MIATSDATDEAASGPSSQTVYFGLAELDLLTTHAGVRMPYPVRVPCYGRTAAERAAVLAMAGATLTARRLADHAGPTGLAAELVAALRDRRSTVDLVLTGIARGPVGVLALRCGSAALVCRQPLARGHTNQVAVTRVYQDGLADELFRDVPRLAGATVAPISLDAGVVSAATSAAGEREEVARDRLRALAMAAGGDPDELDRLAALLPTVTGRGQLGATSAGRRTDELSWLDGPAGRVRIDHGKDGWVSVNPLRPKDIHRFIRRLACGVAESNTGKEPR
ncbi:ESX secretion-associated protein EspG [Actinokineospora iranica]|uniref:EspG family protein n=1 Tax=Actinokineospora iranica TaxID=1271860 RepID=A0A1G6UC08_9PSEU|nr:ESX secretion-associated protein EspG [Actinokineospora iranica]SDD38764.1 EspG family protein [Actinokineospora iranica]